MPYPESTVGTKHYPYWREEFKKEFGKRNAILYCEEKHYNKEKKAAKYEDLADEYRVFMIFCNNNSDKSRMEVLKMLKAATEENPIRIDDEIFWFAENYW